MRLLFEIARSIAEDLEGQCVQDIDSLVERLPDEEASLIQANRLSFHAEIDQRVFLCDGCGWWCSTDELNNDTSRDLCEDCNEEAGDD